MLTGECLSTRHSSCSFYPDREGCNCHCHSLARMPPVQLDYSLSVVTNITDTAMHESIQHDGYHDTAPSVKDDPEFYMAEDERSEYLSYLQNTEYDSGYYQGYYLSEPESLYDYPEMLIDDLDGLPERPVTKAEIEEADNVKLAEEKRKLAVEQALLKTKDHYTYTMQLMKPEEKEELRPVTEALRDKNKVEVKQVEARQRTLDEMFGAG